MEVVRLDAHMHDCTRPPTRRDVLLAQRMHLLGPSGIPLTGLEDVRTRWAAAGLLFAAIPQTYMHMLHNVQCCCA